MANKFWYKKLEENDLYIPKYIQSFIDLYCFNSKQFEVIDDITPENLNEFWKIILRHYQYYCFHLDDLSDLGDALWLYFYYAYPANFVDAGYPVYHKEDKRNLGIYMMSYVQLQADTPILPEDVPVLINYLNTHDGQISKTDQEFQGYLKQFDYEGRRAEIQKRWEAICRERIEAIKNNQPLPIKPMSIELEMCYKNPKPTE